MRLMHAYKGGKVFKFENSFIFVAQVPDILVGISGSRCSFCDNKVAYSHQVCKKCKLPFIGPLGFPQITKWEKLSVKKRRDMVAEIFRDYQKSRVGCSTPQVPLCLDDIDTVENLEKSQAYSFQNSHGFNPKEILEYLIQ